MSGRAIVLSPLALCCSIATGAFLAFLVIAWVDDSIMTYVTLGGDSLRAIITSHNKLFAAEFQVPTLVQIFFVIQCIWTGVMGILVTYDPTFSPINETGVFYRKGSKDEEEFVHPNVRGAWCVRGGSMFLVAAGALFFGTRETYLVAMAAICFREVYDSIEIYSYTKNWDKILIPVWFSPIGPMPPLLSFNLFNALALWAIVNADPNPDPDPNPNRNHAWSLYS